MAAASKKDLFLMILLWNAVLTLSSVPLLSQDPWVNMTWITLILPNILGFMPRGGPLWGRMALDAPFMLLATAIAFITSLIASKIKRRLKTILKITVKLQEVQAMFLRFVQEDYSLAFLYLT